MKKTTNKTLALAASACLLHIPPALAASSFHVGAPSWKGDTPVLASGESLSVFWCSSPYGNNRAAFSCSLALCKKSLGPKSCVPGLQTSDPGVSLILVRPPAGTPATPPRSAGQSPLSGASSHYAGVVGSPDEPFAKEMLRDDVGKNWKPAILVTDDGKSRAAVKFLGSKPLPPPDGK